MNIEERILKLSLKGYTRAEILYLDIVFVDPLDVKEIEEIREVVLTQDVALV